jgi:hypothetical protein
MDYPGRLYFFLINIINGCGDHAKLIWMTAGIFLLLLLIFLALYPYYLKPHFNSKAFSFFKSSYFFLFITFLFVILERLPFMLSGQLTPDEDLWLAGGATIMEDPRFWISFNPTTSGPLVVLPVVLIKIVGFQINYISVRLGALLFCILPSIGFIFFAFKNFFHERIARIIILPLVICISFMHLKSYIAYNSEHVPILLTSLAIFIYSQIFLKGESASSYLYLIIGLVLGSFPFSKLQALPIGAGMAMISIVTLFQEGMDNKKETFSKIVFFLFGCFIPLLVVLGYLTLYNGLRDFWLSFIVSNINYAEAGLNGQIGQGLKFRYFIYLLRTIPGSSIYFITLFFSSCISFFSLFLFKRKELWNHKLLLSLASLIIIASYYGIVKPSTFYEHYFLLFLIPMIFFYGVLMGVFEKAFGHYKLFPVLNAFLIITTVIIPSFYCFAQASSVNLLTEHSLKLKKQPAAEVIGKYAPPGEKMAVWGWKTDLYIQTGLTLGTRYGDSFHQLTKSEQQDYYLNNYLLDLKINKPKIFVDAITSSSFFFNEIQDRHENYSMIDSYIKENYTKVGEVDQIRIYIRN